jgi:HEAT repeat protein
VTSRATSRKNGNNPRFTAGGTVLRAAVIGLLLGALVFPVACSGPKRKNVKNMTRDELLDAFGTENDDNLRVAALRELGKGTDRLALTALLIALRENSEPVKLAAVTALGESKAPEAAIALWNTLNDPTEGQKLRFAAAVSLSKLGDVRAVEALLRSMPRSDALAAILGLGDAAMPNVIVGLRSSATRPGAAAVLIASGRRAVDPLIEVVRKGESKNARLTALKVLSEIEDERAAAAIDEALKEQGPEFTLATYRYLIRAGRAASQPRLVGTLTIAGTAEMARDFITSGNPVLKAAVDEWSKKQGNFLGLRASELAPVYWGGVDPSIKEIAVYHFDGSLGGSTGANAAESKAVSFVPGKWGQAVSVGKGGTLKYPVAGNLLFENGSIEMWISAKLDGADPIFKKYNHALVLYHASGGDQFLVSGSTLGGFYCGSVVGRKFTGTGGGNFTNWKPGDWHHVAFTYSSSKSRQRFYLDGVMVSETTGAMPAPKPGTTTFTVGCDPYGNWTGFDVDELVLSTGEKGADWILRDASQKSPK